MTEFFEMGGYAAYVWPAYGAFALILGGLAVWGVRRNRAVRETLEQIEAERRRSR